MPKEHHNEWTECAEALAPNHRAHAGYFSWETDRAVAEFGVLREFEVALARDGSAFFTRSRHRGQGNDPPDCEAIAGDGGRVGIEITELVDPASAANARVGTWFEPKDWQRDLIPRLSDIIRRKDRPAALKGVPYSDYVLLIHTDEPALDPSYARSVAGAHVFPRTKLITRAYLVISYDPCERLCPCIRLNIEGRG